MSPTLQLNLQALLGVVAFIGVAVWACPHRARISYRLIGASLVLQILLALIFLRVPGMIEALTPLTRAVLALADATRQGSGFVFGYLGGALPPFLLQSPTRPLIFAFEILPVVMVVSALAAVLWHWRVLPGVVRVLALVFERPLNTRGPAGFAVIANVFVGQVEAPLLVRPYVATMSRYELLLLMTAGMTMIAGTMMVVYTVMLSAIVPNIGVHLLVKSIMSIPSAILFAHVLWPEDPHHRQTPPPAQLYESTLDAMTRGTQDGLQIWLAIIAMLVVLVSFVAMVNALLGTLPWWDHQPWSLERLASLGFAPVAFLMGIPIDQCLKAGELLGIKTVINELMAYQSLAALPAATFSPRAEVVITYGLCGFANFASMAIQVSGIAAIAPTRRSDLNQLALRALLGATLASCLSAALVGILAGY